MNRNKIILAVAALFLCTGNFRAWGQSTVVVEKKLTESQGILYTTVVLSNDFIVDRIYKSMEGPMDTQDFRLLQTEKPELLWITGYSAIPVSPDGKERLSQDFLCHSNLDINLERHKQLFGWNKIGTHRFFILSQGESRFEFPKGFGIPVRSDELFNFQTMVLNMNVQGKTFRMKHKMMINFMRDQNLNGPLKPLFVTAAVGAKVLEGKDGYFGVGQPDGPMKGASCSLGEHALKDGRLTFGDGLGRKFTGHWLVKPGREINHTLATKFLNLPFDTTIHYAAVHLHPFAESVELVDLTTGQSILKLKTKQIKKGIGLAHVDTFSSQEGIPVFKDHEYEIVSVYNNTTSEKQDAMVTLFLYLLDTEFKKPLLDLAP